MQVFVGDVVRTTCQFTFDNNPVDPTTVTVYFRPSAGVITTLVYGVDADVIRLSQGSYQAILPVDVDGSWHIRWFGTGVYQSAIEVEFMVERTHFLP